MNSFRVCVWSGKWSVLPWCSSDVGATHLFRASWAIREVSWQFLTCLACIRQLGRTHWLTIPSRLALPPISALRRSWFHAIKEVHENSPTNFPRSVLFACFWHATNARTHYYSINSSSADKNVPIVPSSYYNLLSTGILTPLFSTSNFSSSETFHNHIPEHDPVVYWEELVSGFSSQIRQSGILWIRKSLLCGTEFLKSYRIWRQVAICYS